MNFLCSVTVDSFCVQSSPSKHGENLKEFVGKCRKLQTSMKCQPSPRAGLSPNGFVTNLDRIKDRTSSLHAHRRPTLPPNWSFFFLQHFFKTSALVIPLKLRFLIFTKRRKEDWNTELTKQYWLSSKGASYLLSWTQHFCYRIAKGKRGNDWINTGRRCTMQCTIFRMEACTVKNGLNVHSVMTNH